jgi:hypothetical protein
MIPSTHSPTIAQAIRRGATLGGLSHVGKVDLTSRSRSIRIWSRRQLNVEETKKKAK